MSPSPCFFLSPQNATLAVRALEALGDGLLFVDLKDRRFWANDAFYGLIHEEPLRDEAPLDLWLNGLEEGDRSALESDLSRSGEPFQREFRLLRSDKTPVWLKVRGTTAAFDEERTSGGSLLVVSDISRRKTAEDRTLRGERRFRTLFEAARDGVILCDFEGTILDVNPSVCSALGRNPFELYHKNLAAFLPMAEGKTLKTILETVRGEGEGLFETTFIDAAGEERPVEINACGTTFLDRDVIVAFCRDLTERRNFEASIRRNEERLRLALDTDSGGIWDWNVAAGDIYLSSGWYRMVGLPVREEPVEWAFLMERTHPEDKQKLEQLLREQLPEKGVLCLESRLRTARGDWKWVLVRGRLVERDSLGNPLRLIGTYIDIDDRKRLEQADQKERAFLRDCSQRDDLTGLFNRRALEERFPPLLALAKRKEMPLALILMDIDDFKGINDAFGHLVGDDVLIQATERLMATTRSSDLFCRWGGEEFVLVVNEDEEGAEILARRLQEAMGEVLAAPDHPVTASFGVAQWEVDLSLIELFERADRAMYRAKSLGKNRVIRWSARGVTPDGS